MFFVRLPNLVDRDRFIEHLRKQDVSAVFHYQPLNLSEVALRSSRGRDECPVSEVASETLVRLPLFPDLRASEVDHVIESVLTFKS
jgi:dTDP-4-amino-4,6-dideoxygalactose transaminase